MRVEHGGQVWVASGDYKLEDDGTCAPFEPVRCHTFITESTFGLPIYRWPAQPALFADINAWWAANAAAGKASVLYAYAFGKAQRLLHGGAPELGRIKVSGETREESARAASKAGSCPQRLRWWRDTGPLRLMCGTFAHSPDDRPRGTRGALALGPLVRSRQLGELAPLVLLLHGQVVPRH